MSDTNDNWNDGMEKLLVEELDTKGYVNATHLKTRAAEIGLVNTGHFNRIGPLMQKLIRKHHLVRSGDKVKAGKKAHQRLVAVWKRGPAASTPEPTNGTAAPDSQPTT